MKDYIIYTDDFCEFDEDDLKEGFSINHPEIEYDSITDEDIYNEYYSECEFMADELRYALEAADRKIHYEIIGFADLGLWDGRHEAHGEFKNVSDITRAFEDENTLFVDRYGNLCLRAIHHDGTNYVTFRELKEDELSDKQYDNFYDKLNGGGLTSRDITRYTRAIGKTVEMLMYE